MKRRRICRGCLPKALAVFVCLCQLSFFFASAAMASDGAVTASSALPGESSAVVRGIVTYYDPGLALLYVQDGANGVRVELESARPETQPGQSVEVSGFAGSGARGLVLRHPAVTSLGNGAMPKPRILTVAQVVSGSDHGRWVEVSGLVRAIDGQRGRVVLKLVAGGSRLTATILSADGLPHTQLLGARVKIRGVCHLVAGEDDDLQVGELLVPKMSELTLESPAPEDLFAIPNQNLDVAIAKAAASATEQRVRVRGVVTSVVAGKAMTIGDGGETLVVLSQQSSSLKPGVLVDVVGYPARTAAGSVLADAVFRRVGLIPWPPAEPSPTRRTEESALPMLTTASAIRELSEPEARRGYPVRLRGVVTYYDPAQCLLFVQGASEGITVDTLSQPLDLQSGQLVLVEGVTAGGGFVPVVTYPRIEILGNSPMPEPTPRTLEELLTGRDDSQWIETRGVVTGMTNELHHLVLEISAEKGRFRARIPGVVAPAPPRHLLDARVRLQGVCGSRFNRDRQFIGIEMMVPDLGRVTVEESASSDPYTIPATASHNLFQSRSATSESERVRVTGVITLVRHGTTIFVQDSSGALEVTLRDPATVVRGDLVDVVGFPRLGGYTPRISDAIVRKRGVGTLPPPVKLRQGESPLGEFGAAYDNELVELEAVFAGRTEHPREVILAFEDGFQGFHAHLDKSLDDRRLARMASGSRVKLTGVCSVQLDEWGHPRACRILLRDADDITVLAKPPWWSARRVLDIAGVVGLVILVGAIWTVTLRRTVREQTEMIQLKAQRESLLEARYRDLFENAHDIIYTHDMSGNFTSINRAGERLLGYSRTEIGGINIERIVLPACKRAIERLMAPTDADQDSEDLQILAKDGRVLHLQVSSQLLREGEQVVGIQGIARDVTERKRAEEAVRATEELYRRAIAVADAVPYRRDYSLEQFTFMGEGIQDMTGYSACEMTPKLWHSLVQEVRMQGEAAGVTLEEAIVQAREGKVSRWMNDCRILTRNGEVRWVSDRSIQLFDELGMPNGSIGILQDITDRVRSQQELQRSEARFRRVVESNLIGIVFWNSAGVITDFNGRFPEMLGYSREELLCNDQLLASIAGGGDPSTQDSAGLQLRTVGYCRPFELQLVRKDGRRLPVMVGSTYLDSDKELGVSFVLDISEKANLEEQLRQAQKMESVGRLAGGVAHDFNNMLTVIQGHSCLLLGLPDLPEEMTEPLQEISTAAERAANLTRQLLTFSRKQVVQPRRVDLNSVISQLTKMLTRLLGEDITLQCNYGQKLPPVSADPGMMEQIIMNLAVNARDAMPGGGRLAIRTTEVEVVEGKVPHPKARPGRFVCIAVSDTGCGMDEKILGHIFEPFFTTKEVGKGTGLGLATVYGIVELHKGWIDVESRVGVGSTFQVFLPGLDGVVEVEEVAPKREQPAFGNETILVAEDEPSLRALVLESLTRRGYHVIEAASGVEGLKLWGEHRGSIDLLLTDMVMPDGVGGKELAERLRSEDPELKVIYTTGYSMDLFTEDCELVEGLNFLPKPYDPVRLAKTVRACLDA